MTAPDHNELVGKILVVDDERNIRRTLRMVLEGEGATVVEAQTGQQAQIELAAAQPPIEVVITDVLMPGMSGLDLLQWFRDPNRGSVPVPVIMISGHATVEDAVKATRWGAFDFFEKPLARDRVIISVRNALRQYRADLNLRALQRRIHGSIIGHSDAMTTLMTQVTKVGRSKARVLITGESGSGKELIARAIHDASPRRDQPFVKVNCAAIPRELIESELFGHERGAFTGATAQKPGLFEVADHGTIFLDEIGDMSLRAQAKVLRVLQSGELMRVGSRTLTMVDVRVLAATHKNLAELTSQGEFREDLYFRLNVVPVEVPPLRNRTQDIPLLCRHFIDQSCADNGMGLKRLADDALAALVQYPWPGNVRELRNVIERMVILSDGDLTLSDVPAPMRHLPPPLSGWAHPGQTGSDDLSLRDFREAAERTFIRQRLQTLDWNVSRTAESLGVERTHLHKKMKILGIQRGRS